MGKPTYAPPTTAMGRGRLLAPCRKADIAEVGSGWGADIRCRQLARSRRACSTDRSNVIAHACSKKNMSFNNELVLGRLREE